MIRALEEFSFHCFVKAFMNCFLSYPVQCLLLPYELIWLYAGIPGSSSNQIFFFIYGLSFSCFCPKGPPNSVLLRLSVGKHTYGQFSNTKRSERGLNIREARVESIYKYIEKALNQNNQSRSTMVSSKLVLALATVIACANGQRGKN